MKITLNTVVDTFSDYATTNRIPLNESRSYVSADFLPDDPSEMQEDILYIADLSDEITEKYLDRRYSFICIDHTANGKKDDIREGCLLVRGITSITGLAKIIQKRFFELQNWENKLKEIVINSGTYQDIVDASEYILGNPLQILDASYKLLAFTSNIRSDDEMDVKLTESGFHSQAALRKIQESGRLKAYKEETGIIINHPGNPNKYGTVSKWLWDSGMPVIHILMVCKNGSPSPSLIDIFQVLIDHCRMCFQRMQSQDPQTGNIYDSLIHDILFGGLRDNAEIYERAKIADIPVKSRFALYKVVLRENNDWLIKRVFSELIQSLPVARIIQHQFEIVVLNSFENDNFQAQIKRDEERIWPILKNFDGLCGISAVFENIEEMPEAFSQAAKALSLGDLINKTHLVPGCDADKFFAERGDYGMFYYDDLIIYHMIAMGTHCTPSIFKNSECWNTVSKMWIEDKNTGNDNSQILYTYLVSERKATKTGEILHMHRNNVIYRINKIEEMTGFNLDDYWTRQKILMSFHLLRIEIASGNI